MVIHMGYKRGCGIWNMALGVAMVLRVSSSTQGRPKNPHKLRWLQAGSRRTVWFPIVFLLWEYPFLPIEPFHWEEGPKVASVERFLKWCERDQNHRARSAASLKDCSQEKCTWKAVSCHCDSQKGWLMAIIKIRLTLCYMVALKFSTDKIPFYCLYLGWTSPNTLALVCHCLEAQWPFLVSFPLYYGHRSPCFKIPDGNRLSSEGIPTKSLQIKDG